MDLLFVKQNSYYQRTLNLRLTIVNTYLHQYSRVCEILENKVTHLVIKRKVLSVDITCALKDCWRHPRTVATGIDRYFSLVFFCSTSEFAIICGAAGEPHTMFDLMVIKTIAYQPISVNRNGNCFQGSWFFGEFVKLNFSVEHWFDWCVSSRSPVIQNYVWGPNPLRTHVNDVSVIIIDLFPSQIRIQPELKGQNETFQALIERNYWSFWITKWKAWQLGRRAKKKSFRLYDSFSFTIVSMHLRIFRCKTKFRYKIPDRSTIVTEWYSHVHSARREIYYPLLNLYMDAGSP